MSAFLIIDARKLGPEVGAIRTRLEEVTRTMPREKRAAILAVVGLIASRNIHEDAEVPDDHPIKVAVQTGRLFSDAEVDRVHEVCVDRPCLHIALAAMSLAIDCLNGQPNWTPVERRLARAITIETGFPLAPGTVTIH